MAKPAKSLSERRKELIDSQDYLSREEKEKLKEKTEKAAEKSAALEEAVYLTFQNLLKIGLLQQRLAEFWVRQQR